MALETLKGVTEIDGFSVEHGPDEDLSNWPTETCPIIIDHDQNIIMFKIQNGPIKEVGVNGCQVDTMAETLRLMVDKLNTKYPCPENTLALNGLGTTMKAFKSRKTDRTARGVEGFNKQ